jgi:hypothetical protein
MSRRSLRRKIVSALGTVMFGVVAGGGCANSTQTAAAAATGGLLAVGLGAQALTGSRLDVAVEMYAPTEDQRAAMQLDHRPAVLLSLDGLRGADGLADPTHVSAQDIVTISLALRREMPALAEQSDTLQEAVAALTKFDADRGSPPVQNVITALSGQRAPVEAALETWRNFERALRDNVTTLAAPETRDTLVGQLLALRVHLYRAAGRDAVNADYLDLLKARMFRALSEDAEAAAKAGAKLDLAATQGRLAALLDVRDDPEATGAERIARVLDAVRTAFALVPANSTGRRARVDALLKWFALSIDSAKLARLPSREAVVAALARSSALPAPTGTSESVPACEGDAAPIVVRTCSKAGYNSISLALNRITADVNLGPISNEIAQVLQAANRALGIISDPANAERWRPSAEAKVHAGPGNQNSIVYFENMGLPFVKSSTFDPTKFIVAQGLLYRQVFSAAVAAFGVPLPSTAGAAGGTDFQTSNVIATKARIRNAEKATAAARQKILETLKAAIDRQKGVKDAATDWASKGPAALKAAQDALLGAATQLESVGGAR